MLDLDNAKEVYINGKEVKKLMIGNKVIWEKIDFESILLTTNKNILSYVDNERALLTAQLVDEDNNPVAISGETIDFYKVEYYNDNVSSLTFDLWDYISSDSIVNICFTEDIKFAGKYIHFYQKSSEDGIYNSLSSDDISFVLPYPQQVPDGNILSIEKTSTGVKIYINNELVINKSLSNINWQQIQFDGFSVNSIESVESVKIIGTSVTASNGQCSVYYNAMGTGDINIKCATMNIFSNNIQLHDITYYDSLTTNKNKFQTVRGSANITYTDDGLTIQGTTRSDTYVSLIDYTLPSNYEIEFEITNLTTDSYGWASDIHISPFFMGYNGSTNIYVNGDPNGSNLDIMNIGAIIKLKYENNNLYFYKNNILKHTINNISLSDVFQIKTYYARSTTIKNLKIQEL